MSDQKKNRAFHIHSNMSRHEMPKQLKKRFFINQKNTKSQNEKMSDQKKNRAFHIHSKMSRHEMPKQLKKIFFNSPKKSTKSQNRKYRTKKGHPASTQKIRDTKCQTAKKHNISFPKKLELPKKNRSPIGFSSGWYGGKRIHLRPNDFIIVSALYLMPVFRQYFLAASI